MDEKEDSLVLFRLGRKLYNVIYAHLTGEDGEDAFETTSGLQKEVVERPPIFAVVCDTIMRLFVDGIGDYFCRQAACELDCRHRKT